MNKERNKISNTLSLLAGAGLLVLLMAGAYYYFFDNLKKMGEETSNISNENTTLLAEDHNLDSLHSTFADVSSDQNKINSYFIQSDGVVDFINTIENLAAFAKLQNQTEGVNTTDLTPVSPTHELLHLTFKTTGSWQGTFYFLSLLETLPYNIRINQVSMRASGDTTSEAPLSSDINLSATTSTSTIKVAARKNSVWDTEYDFSVVKLK